MTESRTVGAAAVVVGVGVLFSRILGAGRDALLAALLGVGVESDLYVQAFTIPDYVFFLLAGGFLSITLVPVLSRHLAAGDVAGANRSFSAVFFIVGMLLVGTTVASMVFAPQLTELLFPRAADLPRLTGLTRIALASQIFFGLGTLLMAAQYARRRFVIPSLAPVVYNLGIIAGGAIGAWAGNPGPEGFLWGGLAGAALGNFGLQAIGAFRGGVRLVAAGPGDPAVPEYFALALPLMVGQTVTALDELWPRLFGQFAGTDATAELNYARRLTMLPVGLIAQAAGVAAYPFLASLHSAGDVGELRATVTRSVRGAFTLAVLAAAGVIALAAPFVRVVYERGRFEPSDTATVAGLLGIYALSIPLWAAHQVYTRAFYAQRRMWTPVIVGTAVTVATVPTLVWAASAHGAAGIAVVSVSALAVYTVAVMVLWYRNQPSDGTLAAMGRGLAAGGAAWLAMAGIAGTVDESGFGGSILLIVVGATAGIVVFSAVGKLVGLTEVGVVTARIARRIKPR